MFTTPLDKTWLLLAAVDKKPVRTELARTVMSPVWDAAPIPATVAEMPIPPVPAPSIPVIVMVPVSAVIDERLPELFPNNWIP